MFHREQPRDVWRQVGGWKPPRAWGRGGGDLPDAGGWVVCHGAQHHPSTSTAYGEPGTWGCQGGPALEKGNLPPALCAAMLGLGAGSTGAVPGCASWLRALVLVSM